MSRRSVSAVIKETPIQHGENRLSPARTAATREWKQQVLVRTWRQEPRAWVQPPQTPYRGSSRSTWGEHMAQSPHVWVRTPQDSESRSGGERWVPSTAASFTAAEVGTAQAERGPSLQPDTLRCARTRKGMGSNSREPWWTREPGLAIRRLLPAPILGTWYRHAGAHPGSVYDSLVGGAGPRSLLPPKTSPVSKLPLLVAAATRLLPGASPGAHTYRTLLRRTSRAQKEGAIRPS